MQVQYNCLCQKTYFVSQISRPLENEQKWFCILNLRMDLSFQEKKLFENPTLYCRDIKQKPSQSCSSELPYKQNT